MLHMGPQNKDTVAQMSRVQGVPHFSCKSHEYSNLRRNNYSSAVHFRCMLLVVVATIAFVAYQFWRLFPPSCCATPAHLYLCISFFLCRRRAVLQGPTAIRWSWCLQTEGRIGRRKSSRSTTGPTKRSVTEKQSHVTMYALTLRHQHTSRLFPRLWCLCVCLCSSLLFSPPVLTALTG